ncbi:MAG: hypothetical protein IKL36_00915 [Clostridia bacterium]|nr:hypothetical protein [Clostridia bacterium]
MKQIKNRFYLGFILIPLISLLLAKILYIFASITVSDIYYTGSSSAFLRFLPYLCKHGYLLFDQLFAGASIASVIYSVTYFGKKTAIKSIIAASLSFLAAFVVELVYNVTRNSLSTGQITAAAIAMISELLFFAVILIISFIFASLFLKFSFTSRKRNRLKTYSIYRAAIIPTGISTIIRILDITLFNVIPFLKEYDDIRPDEIADIALDYIYCIGIYFVLTYILAAIVLAVFKSITGALKPKFTGVSK